MGRTIHGLSETAVHVLLSYDYPGNVRELQHAIERGVALCSGEYLAPQDLPPCFLVPLGESPQPLATKGIPPSP